MIAGSGPLLVGVLHEAAGGWSLPYLLIFAVLGAQLLAGLYAGRDRYLEDELAPARLAG
ncbi:hypothetical protein [Nonomuraea cavernae]|uniref:MFS transporter n=1 Tax=Nonomuraea cavernae TaxID=2045107 RepID=A0A917ZIA1_9ACTN|nr:hypothetical protein [Nonomuraea cavernae]MCA2190545.1 hypothetical protein [Nonomuraea cavernae]GGO82654.1 hypothetical protein GCM10012289_74380 [Nonomuraea cavernae]